MEPGGILPSHPAAQIVLTHRHHLRASERYAEAFGCPIRCNATGLHEFEGAALHEFAAG